MSFEALPRPVDRTIETGTGRARRKYVRATSSTVEPLSTQEALALVNDNKKDTTYLPKQGTPEAKLGLIGRYIEPLQNVQTLQELINFLEAIQSLGVVYTSNRKDKLSEVFIRKMIEEIQVYQRLVHASPALFARKPLAKQITVSLIPKSLSVHPLRTENGKVSVFSHNEAGDELDLQYLDLARLALEIGREEAAQIIKHRESKRVNDLDGREVLRVRSEWSKILPEDTGRDVGYPRMREEDREKLRNIRNFERRMKITEAKRAERRNVRIVSREKRDQPNPNSLYAQLTQGLDMLTQASREGRWKRIVGFQEVYETALSAAQKQLKFRPSA